MLESAVTKFSALTNTKKGMCGFAQCNSSQVCCCNATSGQSGFCVEADSDHALCTGSTRCPGGESCCDSESHESAISAVEQIFATAVQDKCGAATCSDSQVCCCNATSGNSGYCVDADADHAICTGSTRCPDGGSCCDSESHESKISADVEFSAGMCGYVKCEESEVCCCNATSGQSGFCVAADSDVAVCTGSTRCPDGEGCCDTDSRRSDFEYYTRLV